MIISNGDVEVEAWLDMLYIGRNDTEGICYQGLNQNDMAKFEDWNTKINGIIKEAKELALELDKRADIIRVS